MCVRIFGLLGQRVNAYTRDVDDDDDDDMHSRRSCHHHMCLVAGRIHTNTHTHIKKPFQEDEDEEVSKHDFVNSNPQCALFFE